MFFSRWKYYLLSIPRLLWHVRPLPTVVRLFLKLPIATPTTIHLRNGLRFKVRNAMDVWIIKEIALEHDYQVSSIPFQDGWNMIDIGGGIGDFAVTTARLCPNSQILSFEPFPESFALLQENLKLNQVRNVTAYQKAVSNTSETLQLQIGTGVAVEHSTAKISAADDPNAIQVQAIGLSDVLDQHSMAQCDYLKIDCEGAEFEMLMNTPAATFARIKRICLEYHDHVTHYTHRDLVRLFEQHGYTVRLRANPVHSYLGMLFAAK